MNILGHEIPRDDPVGEEEATVAASVEQVTVSAAAASASQLASDSDILAAARRGDREAASELLVGAHAPALGRVCLALLGSQTEAEDALQETLLDALEGLAGFRGEGSLRAWLSGFARRRCARRLETRTRRREVEATLPPRESPASAEQLALAGRARRLLEDVKPTEREALVLRFSAELSFREVGEACGIDEAAARKRVSRGLLRLRDLLGEGKS